MLTPDGINDAHVANAYWASQIKSQKQTLPQSFYVSPLTRALDTVNLTFSGLAVNLVPTIKEYLREVIDGSTADRRSSKTFIHNRFSSWKIEAGFSENDDKWTGTTAETPGDQDILTQGVLNDIFSSDNNEIISITSHNYEILSIQRVIQHIKFPLNPGQIIPLLVKVEKTPATPTTTSAWTPVKTCASPPTAYASDGISCPC